MSAVIRPLTESDLPAARRILRTAFGTFLGAPDPENFWADLDYVYGRFAAEHVASFAAEVDGAMRSSQRHPTFFAETAQTGSEIALTCGSSAPKAAISFGSQGLTLSQ